MRLAASGLFALAVLAACSQKPSPSAPSAAAPASAPTPVAAPTPTAASSGAGTAITADQLPTPKAGLWERTSTQDSSPPQTERQCLGGKPVDPLADMPKCASVSIERTAAGGFVLDADCPHNGIDAKLHTEAEGDFASAYTSDSTMTMGQASQPDMVMKNHSTWKYVGACPAGQTPQG